MSNKQTWVIKVGGGYGEFLFTGTATEAEEMRAHKARSRHDTIFVYLRIWILLLLDYPVCDQSRA